MCGSGARCSLPQVLPLSIGAGSALAGRCELSWAAEGVPNPGLQEEISGPAKCPLCPCKCSVDAF